jgi:hypothetical protein
MTEHGRAKDPFDQTQTAGAKALDFRCAFVGDAKTGKTAFLERVLFFAHSYLYFPTLLETYSAVGTAEFYSDAVADVKKPKRYSLVVTDCSGMSVTVLC